MGLKAGDLITFFDGQPIDDARALDELLLRKAGGDAEIKFLRGEQGLIARGRLGAGAVYHITSRGDRREPIFVRAPEFP